MVIFIVKNITIVFFKYIILWWINFYYDYNVYYCMLLIKIPYKLKNKKNTWKNIN